jgi:hypothetical protein
MRLEADTLGRLLGFVEAQGGIGQDMYVLRWEDSTWSSVTHLGYGTKGVRPVPSPGGSHHLVWGGLEMIEPDYHSYLVMNEFVGDTLSAPDTVTTIWAGTYTYAAAVSPKRRWVTVSDRDDLHLFYSDATGVWIEVPVGGQGREGVAAGTIDDTTALVVWRDSFQAGAGTLIGSTWLPARPPPMNGLLDGAPRLLQRARGGYWLSWATIDDYVGVASFRDGVWSPPESVFCAYLRPEAHYSQSAAEMSRDGEDYPAVAWMAVSSRNGLTSVCVCVPSDSGFTVAENLPGSEEGGAPMVARDRNRDVWVVWEGTSGMAWAHTYTRATSSPPTVTGAAQDRVVAWTLSEPAPGSWWAVLRSQGSEPFAEVARLKAGEGLAMSWTDVDADWDTLRYRVRRECMDKQYEWLSDEVLWTAGVSPSPFSGRRLLLVRASSNPAQSVVRFELLNASTGALSIRVYDVHGRLVLRQTSPASGSGRDTIQVDLGAANTAPGTGLFFLRVVDATGKVSPSAKFVLLR